MLQPCGCWYAATIGEMTVLHSGSRQPAKPLRSRSTLMVADFEVLRRHRQRSDATILAQFATPSAQRGRCFLDAWW